MYYIRIYNILIISLLYNNLKIVNMKKILVLCGLMLSLLANAQEVIKEVSKVRYYGAVGLSVGNSTGSDFEHTSYLAIEGGIIKDNITLGLSVGRNNLANFGKEFKGSNIRNYYYEPKTTISQSIGKTSGFLIFGLGNYIDTNKIFIEYGYGVTYTPKKIGYFVQSSNWDGIWYNSLGVSFNL